MSCYKTSCHASLTVARAAPPPQWYPLHKKGSLNDTKMQTRNGRLGL